DLQWADELTLGWVRSLLAREAVEPPPFLLVGALRTDELDQGRAGLQALLDAPGLSKLTLGRLDESALASIVADMLALKPPPMEVVRLVARRSEGNPFFAAETLRAAVGEGLLGRDEAGRWRLAAPLAAAAEDQALALPPALRDLAERRLEGLSPRALEL